MEKKAVTSKIIVNEDSELTDVVREIHKSKAERIILTFTEQTDLLISPINLRVLEESAERENKLLIAQIIQNPTGVRNAKISNIKTIETPSSPVESDWEEALGMRLEEKKQKKRKKEIFKKVKEEKTEKKSFEEKIIKTEEKKEEEKKENGYVDRRGLKSSSSFVSIDQDFPKEVDIPGKGTNEDLSTRLAKGLKKGESPKLKKMKGSKFNPFAKLKGLNKKKAIRVSLIGFFSLLILAGVGGYLYNTFVPLVKIVIFVEAKSVEIEKVLTGDEDIKEVDFENSLIPVKKESATQSLSDDINATGAAFKGEKATGTITIYYDYVDDCTESGEENIQINLEAGQIVTQAGYNFKLVNGVTITECFGSETEIGVIAADIGEEYNIPSGKYFSIAGYSDEEKIWGTSDSDFTGGSKEEYTVLSQTDVDNAVEQLSTTAIEEVKSELRALAQGWEIIEDSIKSEVDKASIKTDVNVGQEATTVNLNLSIKGEALYYSTDGLMEGLAVFLREKAEEDNLFESEEDLELELGEEIETDISIEDIEGDIVKVKIIAKALVKPDVNKTEIQNKLKGMEWEEGKGYINSLNYSERVSSVVFQPMNYPSFLKRFPTREGRILVEVEDYEKDE